MMVPWEDAWGSSGESPGAVYYLGQYDFQLTPSKVESSLPKGRQRRSLVLVMAFHRASVCTLGRDHYLVFFVCNTHHFLVIWGHPVTIAVIQGCILLTALQDPHRQEKTYFCHVPFKMTEMTNSFKQLPVALWCTNIWWHGCCLWFYDRNFPYFIGECPAISHCQTDGELLRFCTSVIGSPGPVGRLITT